MGSTPVGISASRGAAILGLSEYQTELEVWQLLQEEREPGWNAAHGLVLPVFKDSAPLRWGHAFEDSNIVLAEEAHGRPIIDRERMYGGPMGDSNVPVTCHIDGMYINEPGLLEVHEGKTTSAFPFREKWGPPGTDRVPMAYAVQTQHQMINTHAELDIVSLLVLPDTQDHFEELGWRALKVGSRYELWLMEGDDRKKATHPIEWARVLSEMGYFHQYPVPANPDAQKGLLAAYEHFWRYNVIEGHEPEARNYDDIKRLFPEPKGTLVCPPEQASWFAELGAISDEIGDGGSLAKRAEEIRVQILAWARTADKVIDDESRKATIFRDQAGKKLGQFAKNKNGVFVFRKS